jgi:DNA-binding response OmpR family regulator
MFNILVVEDDRKLNKLFCTVLGKNGYHTFSAYNGKEALEILDNQFVDLIISDIMMPEYNGYELTGALRDAGYELPVLMITAKSTFEDKKQGFLSGTDDYMVKPVNVNEMMLRVGALLRRSKIVSEKKIITGTTELNYENLAVTYNDTSIILPQKEFYILYKLASCPERIFTRQQIMDEIWGLDSDTDPRTVDVHINRLRDRLKDNEDINIKTVRGLGYKVEKQ